MGIINRYNTAQRSERARIATACHEAAHAVVAFYFFARFKRVTIVPTKDSVGHVRFFRMPAFCRMEARSYNEMRARHWFYEHSVINFAGQIAEAIVQGRRPSRVTHHRDDQQAFDFACSLNSSQPSAEAWLKWTFLCAAEAVDRHWADIETVTEALLNRNQLTFEDVRKVIDLKPSS